MITRNESNSAIKERLAIEMMSLFGKMLVLFLYMMIGYCCYKKGFFDQKISKALSFTVLNFAGPALVISGTVNRKGNIPPGDLLLTVLIAIFLYVGLFLLALVTPYLLGIQKDKRGIYRLMTIFSNIGFMGFPVVQAMFGDEALLHVAIYQIPYNLLIYTYGIYELTRERSEKTGFQWKLMINIGVIASLVAIALYALGLKTPVFFNETMAGLGNLTAPLSMMVIGIALAQIPLGSLFTDMRLLVFTLLKLLVFPVLGMLLLRQFTDNAMILGVAMVMMATPVGSMTAMMAEQYDADTELTSRGVALSTLLSVVTIPIVGMITL